MSINTRDKDKLGQTQKCGQQLMRLDDMTHNVQLREMYLFKLRKRQR